MAADPNIYFEASFAGIDILISSISTSSGRDVAVQSPSRGDRHVNQDRGLKHLVSNVELLFCDQPGKAPYIERFQQLHALARQGAPQVFSHPLLGSYSARMAEFEIKASSDELCVRASCQILAENEPQFTFRAGAGVSTEAGLEAVSVASEAATNALADLGLASSLPTDILDTVKDWVQGTDLDSQGVFAEVASLTAAIADAIDTLELASNPGNWQAFRAFIGLGFQLGRAAEAVTGDADQVFDLTVAVARPLLAICAEVYGSALATDRADRIASSNRLRTPGLVPKGTILKMIADGARA